MDTSAEHLNTILAQVKEEIAKGRLIENLAHLQYGENQDVVELLVHRQQETQLENVLTKLHPADVARVIENLPTADRQLVWLLQAPSRGGDILSELSDNVAEQIIQSSDEALLQQVLKQLNTDDLSFLADVIPDNLLQDRLNELSGKEQAWLSEAMSYPEDSVGDFMSQDMVVMQEHVSIQEVLATLRKRKNLPSHFDKLFVVNKRGRLVGILPWQQLVMEEPEQLLKEVMAQNFVTFTPEQLASDAARAFERYDLVSAPVLNNRGRPIGRLTIDEIIDFVRDDIAEDALNQAGLHGEEDLFAPVWDSAKNRWMWLSLSLITAFFASRVIGLFEDTITRFVALAALMPIVAAIGGNTGNQITTLVVRGLALAQINEANVVHLIRKELSLSLLNGVVWGAVVGLFALIFYGNLTLTGVIALAMLITLLLAAVLGLSVPLILHTLKRDPALGSGVLVTALTDSLGFFIFLGLASVFL